MAGAPISSEGRAKGTGKKRIEVKEIESKSQLMVTFSKRRKGLVRKLEEYSKLVNYFFAVIVFSPSGRLKFSGNPEVIAKYRKFLKKKEEAREEENKDKENLKRWLRDVRLEEYDTVEKLDALKAKLQEIKDKVAKKLEENAE